MNVDLHPVVVAAVDSGLAVIEGKPIQFNDEVPAYLRNLDQFQKDSAESEEKYFFCDNGNCPATDAGGS